VTRGLASADANVVVAALGAIGARADAATITRVEELLRDARVGSTMHASGPEYHAVAEAAVRALEALGAVPSLLRAMSVRNEVTMADPAYDQGQYIGDYGARRFVVADAALEAVRRVARQRPEAAPAWIDMSEQAWRRCDDLETMMRAVFERAPGPLHDHVRRFLVDCARASAALEGELADAAAVAERIAFEPTPSMVVTAARAAARHAGAPGAPVIAAALARELRREEALSIVASLGPAARPERLRALVPMFGAPLPAPPPRPRAAWDDLLDAVLADLDDDAPRLAFGAWLRERGDPRGDLIALQCAGGDRTREHELLAQHAAAWSPWSALLLYARGFPETVVSSDTVGDRSLSAFRGEPTVRELVVIGLRGSTWLDALAKAPETDRLRKLALRGGRFSTSDLERLFCSSHFQGLRDVELDDCGVRPEMVAALASWGGLRSASKLSLAGNGLGPGPLKELRALLPHVTISV